MQRLRADLLRQGPHTGADVIGNGGDIGQAIQQSAEIKPCAANKNRQLPLCMAAGKHRPRIPKPGGDRIIDIGCDMAKQRMRHLCLLVDGGAGGQNPQRRIDLHGIGIDDDAISCFGKADGQSGLAAGRWSCDEKGLCHLIRFLDP